MLIMKVPWIGVRYQIAIWVYELKTTHRCHTAIVLAARPARIDAHQKLPIETIGLGAACSPDIETLQEVA
ncbi:hypothetical protein X740_16600 [Mesorhizobium sp. LNHC221B00]|nr:hypothetical protein X740_16600 [Mesorhizobium sp. LNHC221B00]